MSEVRPEIVMWQSYWEIKMALEDAQDEIEKLRAALKQARRDALKEAAQQCEGDFDSEMRSYGDHFAAAIRALGEK